jgi:peptide/nickel transport system ATP-binding protein
VAAPAAPLVEVENLTVHFDAGRGGFWGQRRMTVHAVDGVSFQVMPGETLGLVGESGSGKTTTGRAVLRRAAVTGGSIRFKGADITRIEGEALRRLRRHMQLVFQDPYASLNPRMRVGEIVAEPLIVHGIVRSAAEAAQRLAPLLELVGLPGDAAGRYPHAFSGGQRQRIGIARALALEPEFIVADEPVSALDVSIRAQVVNLMQDLQRRLGLAYLFIAHDLSIVRHISHRIAIMYAGKLVEIAGRDAIYESPRHPYTEALLSAVPVPDPRVEARRARIAYGGEVPNPLAPPPGCRFQARCPLVSDQCRKHDPPLEEKAPGQWAACWHR